MSFPTLKRRVWDTTPPKSELLVVVFVNFDLRFVFEGVVGGCHVLVPYSRQNFPEDGPAACTDTQNQLSVEGQSRDSRRPCLPTPISVREFGEFTNTAAKFDFEGVGCMFSLRVWVVCLV